MRRCSIPSSTTALSVCALAAVAGVALASLASSRQVRDDPRGGASSSARQAPIDLPLAFEPNRGQAGLHVAFVARGPGYTLGISADSARLHLSPTGSGAPGAELRMRVAGGSNRPVLTGEGDQGGRSHYFRGPERTADVLDVPHYGRVVARGV